MLTNHQLGHLELQTLIKFESRYNALIQEKAFENIVYKMVVILVSVC